MLEGFHYAPEHECPFCEKPPRVQFYKAGIKFVCRDCGYSSENYHKALNKNLKFRLRVRK